MKFRKMVTVTLYARQQKRHRCIEQSFGLCGRRREWDDSREKHWNMYIIICEIDCQSRFDSWDRVLRADALGWPWGMGWGGRWERARVGWFGRMALKHAYYHMWNELPVQVWCMIEDARGWCTGITQRDGMGRKVRGGFRMGNVYTRGRFMLMYDKTDTIL